MLKVYKAVKAIKIKWQGKNPNKEAPKRAEMQSMNTVLKLVQLRWTGHLISMPEEQFPKKV